MKFFQLRKFIREEVEAALDEAEKHSDSVAEEDREKIGQKVIDNVRKNNPKMDQFELERLRKSDGSPQYSNKGEL